MSFIQLALLFIFAAIVITTSKVDFSPWTDLGLEGIR